MAVEMTPEVMKPVVTIAPATTNGGVESDYVNMKNINRLEICCMLTQAVGHATVLTLKQATDVGGTGVKVMTYPSKIWANENIATDVNARQTDAKNHTVAADITNKLVTFVIEPQELDVNNDFTCVKVSVSDSSQATNFVAILIHAYMKFQGETPPSVIVD